MNIHASSYIACFEAEYGADFAQRCLGEMTTLSADLSKNSKRVLLARDLLTTRTKLLSLGALPRANKHIGPYPIDRPKLGGPVIRPSREQEVV